MFIACTGSGKCYSRLYQQSSKGVDLAPGEWTGFSPKTLNECKELASAAQALYFAWTDDVYNGYCKVSTGPCYINLGTNQGYGYKLWECA